MTKLIVDGEERDVPPECPLLQACEAAGAEIPIFCNQDWPSIASNCRMCLVEVPAISGTSARLTNGFDSFAVSATKSTRTQLIGSSWRDVTSEKRTQQKKESDMNVGFIGLGHMGSGMAANLIKAGHTVTVYNRTKERTEPLVALGADAAKNLADACKGDAVFTMLANDDAVKSVVYVDKGVLANLSRGAIHISSSTISVNLSERLAVDHAAVGQRFIAAPVFGRPDVAAAGKLYVITAGEPDAIAAAGNLFDAIGQGTFNVSKTPKAANLVKLSGNFLIASVIESVGEALALVSKGGVDRRQYINILTPTLFNAPVYKTYGGLLAERNFEPAGFAAPFGHKDIRLALAAAEEMRVAMPLASLLNDQGS